jgi:molybdopterin synthase sulfur carrier subunit
MTRLIFTQQLRRFTETPEVETSAAHLREALETAFAINPKLRGYILDDQGNLRPHVMIFIDDKPVTDRLHLSDPVANAKNIHVLQALSGG